MGRWPGREDNANALVCSELVGRALRQMGAAAGRQQAEEPAEPATPPVMCPKCGINPIEPDESECGRCEE